MKKISIILGLALATIAKAQVVLNDIRFSQVISTSPVAYKDRLVSPVANGVFASDGTKLPVSLTPSQVLDLIGSTQGTLLHRGASGWETKAFGGAGGIPGPLDGSGKIPQTQLPPLSHDVGEAANQAAMLALPVTAPAMALRTDFSPPHLFFLTADPATTLANWHDTGELGAGAANPTAQIGTVAVNGVLSTFMRSDAAPALSQAIIPQWSAMHTFILAGNATNSTVRLGGLNPYLEFFSASAPLDEKKWIWRMPAANKLGLSAFSDSGVTIRDAWNITRSGSTISTHEWFTNNAKQLGIDAAGVVRISSGQLSAENGVAPTAAGLPLVISGGSGNTTGAGGNVTINGGSSPSGRGGSISIKAGITDSTADGGDVTIAAAPSSGGKGGQVSIGAGGGAATNQDGGNVIITSGIQGTGGQPGQVQLMGANAKGALTVWDTGVFAEVIGAGSDIGRFELGSTGFEVQGPANNLTFSATDGTNSYGVFPTGAGNTVRIGTLTSNSSLELMANNIPRLTVSTTGQLFTPNTYTPGTDFALTTKKYVDDAIAGGGGDPVGANPTALLGTTANNGVAGTFMRSDASPAINQAMVPTWTGQHTFGFVSTPTAATARIASTNPQFETNVTNAAADAKRWNWAATGTAMTFRALNDAGTTPSNIWSIARSAGVATSQQWFAGGSALMSLAATGWKSVVPGSYVTSQDGNKLWLAKYDSGTGHSNAPTAIGASSTYLQVGGKEYGNNGFGGIGFSYVGTPAEHPAVWIGWEEKNTTGNTMGDFLVATRNVTTNTAPTERFRITNTGDITAAAGYTPATALSLATKAYVDAHPGTNLTPAAPTAQIGPNSVAGVATTYMRSDAAPAMKTDDVSYVWGTNASHSFLSPPVAFYDAGSGSYNDSILVDREYVKSVLGDSGQYTPTVSIQGGSATVYGQWRYTKVGQIVTASGMVAVNPTNGGSVLVTVSLPIAMTVTTDADISGLAIGNLDGEPMDAYGRVYANTNPGGNNALINVNATAGAERRYSVTFSYAAP